MTLPKMSEASYSVRSMAFDAAPFDGAVEADTFEDLAGDLGDRLGDEVADQQDDEETDELWNEGGDLGPSIFNTLTPPDCGEHSSP